VLVGGCLALGLWQFSRATGGNTLSWAYVFEWPLFAGFVGWMWLRAARDDLTRARGADPFAAVRPAPLTPRRPSAPVAVDAVDDPQLAAYNRYLAWLAANPDRKPSEYPSEQPG
jgi:hypothetical protein